MQREGSPLLVACSVFRPEIAWLRHSGRLQWEVRYLDSNLHMEPALLAAALDTEVALQRQAQRSCLLCYGDCDPEMHQRCAAPDVSRPRHGNCVSLLVGKERWRCWIREGAFVLLPEWTRRWRELLLELPGLDSEQTRELMREQHRSMVYVDTGVMPVPAEELSACEAHFGLPIRVEAVGLEHLIAGLERAWEQRDAT